MASDVLGRAKGIKKLWVNKEDLCDERSFEKRKHARFQLMDEVVFEYVYHSKLNTLAGGYKVRTCEMMKDKPR